MLIAGAKGLAKEIIIINNYLNPINKNLVFFDDVSTDLGDFLYDKFPILKNEGVVKDYFNNQDKRFALGVGEPFVRHLLDKKLTKLGGKLTTIIPSTTILGEYETILEEGVIISTNVIISNSVLIKRAAFINANTTIGHDTEIGKYAVVCPACNINGNCTIGDYTFIGTGTIIHPNVKIGKNVSIGAGSIIRKDVPDNAIVFGTDGKIAKFKEPLNF